MWVRKHEITEGEATNRIPKFRKLLQAIVVALETGWSLYLPEGDWITLHKLGEDVHKSIVVTKDNMMNLRKLYDEGYYITSGAVIFLTKGDKVLGFDYILGCFLSNPEKNVEYKFPLDSLEVTDKLNLTGVYTKIYKTIKARENLNCTYKIWW